MVTVKELAQTIDGVVGDSVSAGVEVTDVTHDSRQAKSGSLFVAVRGELFDAHKFVPEVMQQGVAGILSELEPPTDWGSLTEMQSGRGLAPAAWIRVENIRRAMALAAAAVHHHPSRELDLVGITGTNGKTTCAYLIASIPEAAGEPLASTGTVRNRPGEE